MTIRKCKNSEIGFFKNHLSKLLSSPEKTAVKQDSLSCADRSVLFKHYLKLPKLIDSGKNGSNAIH
jgi:hypothetical protein